MFTYFHIPRWDCVIETRVKKSGSRFCTQHGTREVWATSVSSVTSWQQPKLYTDLLHADLQGTLDTESSLHSPEKGNLIALPLSLSLSLTHTHAHTQTRTHARTHTLTHLFTHARTHAHTLSLSLSHTHTRASTHTHTHTHCHSLTHTYTH